MGKLLKFRRTEKAILRLAKREMEKMYQLSGGGQDPIPSDESRELFEIGWVDEVKWLDWPTYCTRLLNRLFEENQ
jgi:hypothetical protein